MNKLFFPLFLINISPTTMSLLSLQTISIIFIGSKHLKKKVLLMIF
jgi:hypothetical protein